MKGIKKMNQVEKAKNEVGIDENGIGEFINLECLEPKTISGTQPIRIRAEQYKKIVSIANESRNNISDLASDLIEFALNHVKIQKKVTDKVTDKNN